MTTPLPAPGTGTLVSTDAEPRPSRPSVVFVCVKNGGKSQMAAGLMHKLTAGMIEVASAGTQPGTSINDLSAQAMQEEGIDISQNVPRFLSDDVLTRADLVVTLGREATVHTTDGTPVVNWDTDEPSERGIDGIERMRLVRDDIGVRVQSLADQLLRARDAPVRP